MIIVRAVEVFVMANLMSKTLFANISARLLIRYVVCIFALLLLPIKGYALTSLAMSDASGNSSSAFAFSLHSQATIFHESSAEVSDYIIALDKYKKIDNRWKPEKQLRQQGQLTRYTIELPQDYFEDEVFAFYQDQIPTQAELLFRCYQRQCGESNNWANDHFKIKQLYGANNTQSYAVYRLNNHPAATSDSSSVDEADNQLSTYVTMYTVRRGNRRLYTQLEILVSR